MEGELFMRLKEGWMLTEIAGEYVAVPTSESAQDFRGIVRLNETCKDIWEGLQKGWTETEIARYLVETYDGVDMEQAEQAVCSVVEKLKGEGLLVE